MISTVGSSSRPARVRAIALLGGLSGAVAVAGLVALIVHSPEGPGGVHRGPAQEHPRPPSASPAAPPADGASAEAGVDVFALPIGACYVEVEPNLGTVREEQCSQPHDGEIYHRFPVAGGGNRSERFPGNARIEAEADASCETQFAGFVGVPVERSSLSYLYWFPDETDWSNELRDVLCVVVAGTEGEKVASSARGIRR